MASRFDKYLTEDKTLVKKADVPKKTWQSNMFLIAAGLMLVVALLSFVFQDKLMEANDSAADFLYPLVFGVLFALFFMMAYRSKKMSLTLLGRGVELQEKPDDNNTAPSYNMFKSESATDVKLQQTRRKKTRHLRKQFARQEKET
jgi:hypothetical protein